MSKRMKANQRKLSLKYHVKRKHSSPQNSTKHDEESADPSNSNIPITGQSRLESGSLSDNNLSHKLKQSKIGSLPKIDSYGPPKYDNNVDSSGVCENDDSFVDVTGVESESDYILSQLQGHHDEWKFSSTEDSSSVSQNKRREGKHHRTESADAIHLEENTNVSIESLSSPSDITEAADLVPYIQQKLSKKSAQRESLFTSSTEGKEIQKNKVNDVNSSHNWLLGQIFLRKRKRVRTHSESRSMSSSDSENTIITNKIEPSDKTVKKQKLDRSQLLNKNHKKLKNQKIQELSKMQDKSISEEISEVKKSSFQASNNGEYLNLTNKEAVATSSKKKSKGGEVEGLHERKSKKDKISKKEKKMEKKREKKSSKRNSKKVSKLVISRDNELTEKLYSEFLRSKGLIEDTLERLPSCSQDKASSSKNKEQVTTQYTSSGQTEKKFNNVEPKKKKKKKKRRLEIDNEGDIVEVVSNHSSPERSTDKVSENKKSSGLEDTLTSQSDKTSIKKKKNESDGSGEESAAQEGAHDSSFGVSDNKRNKVEQKRMKKKKKQRMDIENEGDIVEVVSIHSSPERSTDKVSRDKKKSDLDDTLTRQSDKKSTKKKKNASGGSGEETASQEEAHYSSFGVSDNKRNKLEQKKMKTKKKQRVEIEDEEDHVDEASIHTATEKNSDVFSEDAMEKKVRKSSQNFEKDSQGYVMVESRNNVNIKHKKHGEKGNMVNNHGKETADELNLPSTQTEEFSPTCYSVDLFQESQESVRGSHNSSRVDKANKITDKLNKRGKKGIANIQIGHTSPQGEELSSSQRILNSGGSSEQSVIQATPSTQEPSPSPWHRLSRDSNGSFTLPTPQQKAQQTLSPVQQAHAYIKGQNLHKSQRTVSSKVPKSRALLETSSSEDEANGSDSEERQVFKPGNLKGLTQRLQPNLPHNETIRTKKVLSNKLNQFSEPYELISLEEKSPSSSCHTTSQKSNSTVDVDVDVGVDPHEPNQSTTRNSSDSFDEQGNSAETSNMIKQKKVTLKEIVMNRIHKGNDHSTSSSSDEGVQNFSSKEQDLRRSCDRKKSKSSSKVHKCTRCKKLFDNITLMMQHECTRVHQKKSSSNPRASYECGQCDRKYVQRCHLLHHIRTFHQGRRDYKCAMCPMAFAEKQTLVVHMRVHTGAEPFKCTLCRASFTTRNNLHTHYRTNHYLVPKYFCRFCDDKSYYFKCDLDEHLTKVHSKKQLKPM